jgi:hypothetical protein
MRKKARPTAARPTTRHTPENPLAPVATAQGGLLIALELGGEFPSLHEADSSARRVLTQLEGETPVAFADRVASGLETLFARGVELRTVALACNERIDPVADAARRNLVGLALGAMAKHRAGKVYLTASARSSGRTRHYLSALAQGSFEEWRCAGLEVSVDFGREAAATSSSGSPRARVA